MEDVKSIIAGLLYAGIPFKVNRTGSYIRIDTDSHRLSFSAGGELNKVGPKPADRRRKSK